MEHSRSAVPARRRLPTTGDTQSSTRTYAASHLRSWPMVRTRCFRDAIREFVDRLKDSHIETVVVEEPHMFHVFPILMPWAQASRRVYQAAQEFVTLQLSRATTTACEVRAVS